MKNTQKSLKRVYLTDTQCKNIVYVILLAASIARLFAPDCLADDCLRYFAYSTGALWTPELLPMAMLSLGFWVVKVIQVACPIVFSLGLWLLLHGKVSDKVLVFGIALVNFLPAFNLFWMVLLKNGLMISFLPYFVKYLLEGKNRLALIFLILMGLSHLTFALLAAPMLFMSKSKKLRIAGLAFVIIMAAYYLGNQSYIVGKVGGTNFNYLFVDFLLVAFAAMSKKTPLKWMFLFVAFASVGSLLMVEAWRVFITLNIAALIPAMAYLDSRKERVFDYLMLGYALVAAAQFVFYITSLTPYV